MEAIKEGYSEAAKTYKAELPKFFTHKGIAYDIPLGWDIVKTGNVLEGDRAFLGGDRCIFLNIDGSSFLAGGSVKDRICIIRKMTAKEIDQKMKEAIEEIVAKMDKDEFLKAIKKFLGE